jgi:hypothetical protein
MGTMSSVWSDTRLHNEDSRPAELELRELLEMAVEDDWEEMVKKKWGVGIRLCKKKRTSCVLQLQQECYIYSAAIRCQDMTSEEWEHQSVCNSEL